MILPRGYIIKIKGKKYKNFLPDSLANESIKKSISEFEKNQKAGEKKHADFLEKRKSEKVDTGKKVVDEVPKKVDPSKDKEEK